jgi:hypothetical protein
VGEEGKGVTQGTTFLDVLKAILCAPWPWASVVVISFLLFFRKPLVALIGRVRKFGRGAWNAEVEPSFTGAKDVNANHSGDAVSRRRGKRRPTGKWPMRLSDRSTGTSQRGMGKVLRTMVPQDRP